MGVEPVQKISRFDKSKKEKIQIDCPQIVKDYKSHMGGVDLLDSYIGRYYISIEKQKVVYAIVPSFIGPSHDKFLVSLQETDVTKTWI